MENKSVLEYVKPGDFVISWGKGFIGWLVSKLIYILYGTKNPPSHCMHIHDKYAIASAELNGYRILNTVQRLLQCKRYVVFRFGRMYDARLDELQQMTTRYTSKGYDIALYLIHLFRVMVVFLPLVLTATGSWKMAIALFCGMLLLYTVGMRLLHRWERATVHCAEAERTLYTKIGLVKSMYSFSVYSPHSNYELLMNLEHQGFVEIVYDSALTSGKKVANHE